jgi:hypothetical protein
MEFLTGDALDDLFRSFTRSAFHLEVQDSYHTPEESGPFALFLAGKPDDFAWHQPYLRLVREAAAAGKAVTRVRVVTVPHVAYTRWGLTVAEHNIAAGEEIRWLPRHLTAAGTLPADDFWLFDDSQVVFTIFEPAGRFAGGASTTDPVILDYCRGTLDRLWPRAIPHEVYRDSQYTRA